MSSTGHVELQFVFKCKITILLNCSMNPLLTTYHRRNSEWITES